jgi:CubicO group peptidase (beta-lactamase class C family)
MLLRRGELGGVRILAPSTLELMSRNFLPDGADLHDFAVDSFSETSMAGIGFGLGFGCVVDRAKLRLPTAEGTITWGGAASTTFWVDPRSDLSCEFFTQLIPSSTYPIRRELQRLTYQALVD